jgi:hypothetical protein
MEWYLFMLAGLGVWRFTNLLNVEEGPGGIFARLRAAAGSGIWRDALGCFHCLSLLIAIPFALVIGDSWVATLLLWPALSAAAILLERLIRGADRAIYIEDEEQKE